MPKVQIRANELQMRFSPLPFLLRKTNFNWIQLKKRQLDISVHIFCHASIHIIYSKTVAGFVDIQFASWTTVMKKMKFLAENWFFLVKSTILKKDTIYRKKHRASFGGHLQQNHSRKQKVKSDIAFRNWIQNSEKKVYTKSAKTMSYYCNMWRKKV